MEYKNFTAKAAWRKQLAAFYTTILDDGQDHEGNVVLWAGLHDKSFPSAN